MDHVEGRDSELLEASRRVADAFCATVGGDVAAKLGHLRHVHLTDLPALMGSEEDAAVGVYFQASGSFEGQVLLLIHVEHARRLADLLLGPGASSELVLDACREIGNIVTSSFLSSIADRSQSSALPSTPLSTVDMAGAIITSAIAANGGQSEFPAIDLKVQTDNGAIEAMLLVLPHA